MKLSAALAITLAGVAAAGGRPELRVVGERARISLGPEGDTRLERQGVGELVVQASVEINGTLNVREDLAVNGVTIAEIVAGEVTAQLDDTVAAEVTAQLDDTVAAEITAQLGDAVEAEVTLQLDAAVVAEVAAQIDAAVAAEVDAQLDTAVSAAVAAALSLTGRTYTSCQGWFLAWQGNLPDGVYAITVLGATINVYCDMRNGGFTRVVNVLSTTTQSAYMVTGAVSAGTTASTTFYKLSDNQINDLAANAGNKDYLYICGDEVRAGTTHARAQVFEACVREMTHSGRLYD